MSHLPFTILAYILNSIAVTVDKFLLSKHIPDPLIYVFYFSVYSLISLLLLPLTTIPEITPFVLASASTLLWTSGAYFMFKALQVGLVSRVIPMIGTLIPLILLLQSFFTGIISINEVWAVIILILGLVFLTFVDWKGKITRKEVIFITASACFFTISYLFLRQAYLQENFLTVFVWGRLILIPVGCLILTIPSLRRRIFTPQGLKINPFSKVGVLFFSGQLVGGVSELLLTFSVSLANPALVNSLQGIQYVFLFLFGLILSNKYPTIFKENLSFWKLTGKILGILFIALGLFILAFSSTKVAKVNFGVTYSPIYAQSLGLDPKTTFTLMISDLNLKHLRLPVYWSEVERDMDEYNFSEIDYYLEEAEKNNIEVILVLGHKQPRWPECFTPSWALNLPKGIQEEKILKLIDAEIKHFKKYSSIKIWQLENEPFFDFGFCTPPDQKLNNFFEKEISLIKNLDKRPILITDTGELSNWNKAIKYSDVFGFSLYRSVWSPYFGTVEYPLPPFFYYTKDTLSKFLTNSEHKKSIISELQAEPWAPAKLHLADLAPIEQTHLFPAKKMQSNIDFALETKYTDIYLWGVEWWYYMDKNGYPEYINVAKNLFHK